MNIGDLYPAILSLVLVGVILGVGILILDKLGSTSGMGVSASTAINATRDSVDDFAGWISTIVVIIAASVIIGLVVRSFGSGGNA